MNRYLRERTIFGPLISSAPAVNLGVVVVIPAKDEEETLIRSLHSLLDCDPPNCAVEVIVVVNTSEADAPERVERNKRTAEEAGDWARRANTSCGIKFHILQCHGLPAKHAGVGLARKIGMDEACQRLEKVNNPAGVLACFDADSRCASNYLAELESLFVREAMCQACSIRFEHPTEGSEHPQPIYDAIVLYELHLRYFVNAQRFAGYPFALQTIGSSMAVRCSAYQQQNGMNKRKAGEDFYFLHKFTPLGTVANLNTTCVIPSPRVSARVPFGTGKAVGDMIESGDPIYQTYAPRSFEDLKLFIAATNDLYQLAESDRISWLKSLPNSIRHYLSTLPFWDRIDEIRANVTSADAFRIRFFRWFNAFLLMKYLHQARDRYSPNSDVIGAARWLLMREPGEDQDFTGSLNARELLNRFRRRDQAT